MKGWPFFFASSRRCLYCALATESRLSRATVALLPNNSCISIGKVLSEPRAESVCLYVSHGTSMMRSFGLPVDVTPPRPNLSNDCSRSSLRTA